MPFEVPEGWIWTTLGTISYDLQYGTSEKSSCIGDVPVLRMGNITRLGTIDYSDLVFSSCEEDIKKYSLQYDDLLFNRTNSSEWVGKTAIFKSKRQAIYAGYLIRVRTIGVVPDYLNLVMNSTYHRDWCNQVKTDAVNQSNINAQKLSKYLVPIPPITEQYRIIVEADQLFTVIAQLFGLKEALSEQITQAKAKVLDLAIHGKLVPQDPADEPVINMLRRINPGFQPSDNPHYEGKTPDGWTLCMLGEASDYGRCTSVPVDDINDDEWVLELEDIEKDSGRILHRLAKKDRAISGIRHRFKKGQVLYSKLRTYLNKVLVASEDGYCTTEIIPITPINGITPQYLCFVLRSPYFLDYTARCGYGVKMPRLGTNDAKRAIIPIPPITEQSRIVNKTEVLFSELERIVALDSIQLTE